MGSQANTLSRQKLRWLFWLRWKMFTRGYTRGGVGKIIGTIFLAIFILFIGLSIATGTFFAYRAAPKPINTEILFLVLAGIFLVWILLPLLAINVNEGLDLSKLALFPLTRTELMASMLASTLLDIPSIGLVFILGAVVVGWATSLALGLLTLVTMLVFYVQLVAINQLVLALLQPLLQSRRFRDLSILLTVVLGASGYLCNIAIRGLSSENFVNAIKGEAFSPYLQWLPPGMAARTVQQAAGGNWGMSFVWLIALAIVTGLFLYLGTRLIEWSMITVQESQGGGQQRVRRRQAIIETDAQATTSGRRSLLPTPVLTLLKKDLLYFWRDPQLKVLLIQSLVSVVFFIFIFVFPQASSNQRSLNGSPLSMLLIPNVVLLSVFTLSYNALGFERESLGTLMLFPIQPKYILWAKNLLAGLLGIVEMIIVALVIGALTHGWSLMVPGLTIGLAGLGVIIGIGNFTSVYFPQKVRLGMRGMRNNNISSEDGCLRAVTSLVAMIVTALVLAPVILGIILPYVNGALWIWTLVIPGALIYGAAIYIGLTALVAPRIVTRTPEIVAVVTRE